MTGLAVLVAAISGGIGWITHHVHQEDVLRIGARAAFLQMTFWFLLAFHAGTGGRTARLAEYEVRRRASGATRRRLKINPTGRYVLYCFASTLLFAAVPVLLSGTRATT